MIITIVLGCAVLILTIILLFHIFGNHSIKWTSIDSDWADKQYGFMCCRCDKELEDGQGEPRICDDCANEIADNILKRYE